MKHVKEISSKKDLLVMEDCCEAHGAEFKNKKVGTIGDIGTFSFFISHHITTIEGGMIVTKNKMLHELSKSLRAFGWIRDLDSKNEIIKKYANIDPRFLFTRIGYNLRPTEIQGAFGIHQIKKLDKFIKKREDNTKYWSKKLSQYEDYFILQKQSKNTKPVNFCYPLTIREDAPFNRESLVKFLEKNKIETRPIMAGNFIEQPVIKYINHTKQGVLPNSKLVMKNSFFFGNHHKITSQMREFVVEKISEFIERKLWK
jgi:CDP-6-deoxy-D-xylo-4-hexulose-3-dehydrase